MTLQRMRFIPAAAILAWAVAMPAVAPAQSWPSRPITIVVPFGAGGSIDIPARRLAAELSQKLGQQVVVENRFARLSVLR